MRHIPILTVALALTCLVHPATSAEDVAPPPEVTKWKPLIGHWVSEEVRRSSEDEPWEEATLEFDLRFAPGEFFVETPGKMTSPSDDSSSWIQVWGYDPSKKAAFSHWYGSTGAQGHSTYQWHGRNVKLEGTDVMPDGSQLKIRCNWTNAEDYTSLEFVCEQFTSGKWWLYRKLKAEKVK